MLETNIMKVAQQFAREIAKLEARREGTSANITLNVRSTYSGIKMDLQCNFWDADKNSVMVKAASLGQLMDEVHRRCAFSDKMAPANDANDRLLLALTDQRSTHDEYRPEDEFRRGVPGHPDNKMGM